jgi:hypothetical protein
MASFRWKESNTTTLRRSHSPRPFVVIVVDRQSALRTHLGRENTLHITVESNYQSKSHVDNEEPAVTRNLLPNTHDFIDQRHSQPLCKGLEKHIIDTGYE